MAEKLKVDPAGQSTSQNDSEVAGFFKGRSVLITGATGFVGKVLLEKLLYSCCHVRTVYILIRPKEGQQPKDRLEELLSTQVFHRLRKKGSTVLTKVQAICGDITLPGLGISDADVAVLCKNVSVVVHCAATVRFDEPLKKSVELNLVATESLLNLAMKMQKLTAFVHVSTAYSCCNREEIDEVVYPEKVHYERVIETVKWMDDSLLECLLPQLMDGRPTTYHYTKGLAESLLAPHGSNIPIAIVRPSIVTAAYKEPMPGWIDGVNGPTAFIIATGRGLLRTMLVYKNSAVDWVPVDVLANLILTACWNLGTQKPQSVKVYNITSGNLNRITWSDIERTAYPLITRHPSMKVMRYPGGSFKSSKILNTICVKLEHSLPAHIIDGLARLVGQKTEFASMVTRMERAASYLEYFTTKQWTFHSRNVLDLMAQQNPTDRMKFNFDLRPIEWNPYLESYVLGIRKFILKENESTLPAARRKLARLYYGGMALQWLFIYGCLHLILSRTNLSHHVLWALIGFAIKIMQKMPKSWLRAMNFI